MLCCIPILLKPKWGCHNGLRNFSWCQSRFCQQPSTAPWIYFVEPLDAEDVSWNADLELQSRSSPALSMSGTTSERITNLRQRARERERENLLNHGKWQGTHNNLSIDDAKWGLSKVVIEIVYIKIVDVQDFYAKGFFSFFKHEPPFWLTNSDWEVRYFLRTVKPSTEPV